MTLPDGWMACGLTISDGSASVRKKINTTVNIRIYHYSYFHNFSMLADIGPLPSRFDG